jgi:hypothetical protein
MSFDETGLNELNSLGLFSGDMSGDNKTNAVDVAYSQNYMFNRRPLLSLIGVRNVLNIDKTELSSILTFYHDHSSQLELYNKYFIVGNYSITKDITISLNMNNPFQSNHNKLVNIDTQETDTKRFEYTYTFTKSDGTSFAEETYIQFKILYNKNLDTDLTNENNDENSIETKVYQYSTNFLFTTPTFRIDQGFDLAPGFTSVNFENNATLIATIDNVSIKEGDVIAAYDENDEIHSYESLRLAKNTPQLPGTDGYYFAGTIGIGETSKTMSYKYWDSETQKLHNLSYNSGTDPTLVAPNSILGSVSNPVKFVKA